MRERALLLGGTLRVDRGVNGIGTTVHACVPVVVPGAEAGGPASSGTLDIAALSVRGAEESSGDTGPEHADVAVHRLHQQLRAAQAESPVAAGLDTATLMRAIHPTANGRTRF
jgi:hypothetical protein